MQQISPVTLTISANTAGAGASIASVFDVLRSAEPTADSIAKIFPDFLDTESSSLFPHLRDDACDLLLGEAVTKSTVGALEFFFKPSDRYLEFVAAIASDRNVSCDFDIHGWPVLSLASDNSSVTEAGGESIAPGGRP